MEDLPLAGRSPIVDPRLLDLNLSYLHGTASDRLLEKGNLKEALAEARKAAQYAPARSGAHLTLGIVEYLNGDQEAALKELLAREGESHD